MHVLHFLYTISFSMLMVVEVCEAKRSYFVVDLYGYIGHIATYDYYSLQRSQEYIDLFFILFSRINTDCIKQNLVHE